MVGEAAGRRFAAWAAALSLALLICLLFPIPAHSQADTAKAAPAAGPAGGTAAPPALPRIAITTEKYGDIVVELYPKEAPKAVERILTLVKAGFYNGLPFHRVESYVIQTGYVPDSEYPQIEGEMFSGKLTHEDGSVGMARLPDDYDSASTQFYICKEHLPLMNHEYTVFGKVVQGLDIVHKVKKGDKIKTIKVLE